MAIAFGFLAPLAILIAYSFGDSDFLTFDVSVTGTVDPYRKLFSVVYRPVLLRSFAISMFTVLACIAIGTPAALAVSRMRRGWSRVALGAVIAPSFVSFTVRVHGWSNLLGNRGVVAALTGQTLLFKPTGVALSMLGIYLPLYVLPVVIALDRIDQDVVDAAADLGAPRFRTTRRVVLPIAKAGIITGSVLVGVLAIGEYIVPAVIGGGKVLLLGNLLNDQAGGRDQPLGGAIAVLILMTMAIGAAVARIWGRDARA